MEGSLETTYDKFIFRVKEGYLYLKEDFWAKIDGNSALVGISDFLQKARGDVAFLETVEAGSEVRQGEGIGTIETIKATFAIIAPVTGRVMEINPNSRAVLICSMRILTARGGFTESNSVVWKRTEKGSYRPQTTWN